MDEEKYGSGGLAFEPSPRQKPCHVKRKGQGAILTIYIYDKQHRISASIGTSYVIANKRTYPVRPANRTRLTKKWEQNRK